MKVLIQTVSWLSVLSLVAMCAAEAVLHPSLRAVPINENSAQTISVLYDTTSGKYEAVNGISNDASVAAWAWFEDTIETIGWAKLMVKTNPKYEDNVSMYAAGYAEGVLTQHRSYQYMQNMMKFFFTKNTNDTVSIPPEIPEYMEKTLKWTKQSVKENPESPYWRQVGYSMQQWSGLAQGYFDTAPQSENIYDEAHLALGWFGDMLDLTQALQPERRLDWLHMKTSDAYTAFLQAGHCSALIKVTGDLSDLYFSHTSWFTYSALIRMVKNYDFPLNDKSTNAKRVVFSSYPLNIASLDDYYLMSSGLVVIETSNNIFDTALYQKVQPKSVLSWIRTVVSNRMARGSKEWTEIFAKENSGTYNNQWMILDTSLFQPGIDIKPDTLWITEQIPGHLSSKDVSRELQKGYWPSYNIPYMTDIFEMSGYEKMVQVHGQDWTYGLAPRASIFRRDAASVQSFDDLKKIMRYNDYENDPYAHDNPGNAISSRFDLLDKNPSPQGGYDTKASSFRKMYSIVNGKWELTNLDIDVQLGPTHDQQPGFNWESFPNHPHEGIPDSLVFDWVEIKEDRGKAEARPTTIV